MLMAMAAGVPESRWLSRCSMGWPNHGRDTRDIPEYNVDLLTNRLLIRRIGQRHFDFRVAHWFGMFVAFSSTRAACDCTNTINGCKSPLDLRSEAIAFDKRCSGRGEQENCERPLVE